MGQLGGHYAKCNKPATKKKTNTAKSHLYVESKKLKFIKAESRIVAAKS